ncbi:MAG: SDR family oxidoreductase [Rhodospirillaceae bacterium]|jgi:NAD(P)-dependent dehydrogenase (short-subunit alcohol dehydrogenase family)|nr:SDR family oxidoreductase [Rhodospirillaceae bacterium]MBT4687257.1 SDR family oxidoreductase [Rhodospirillaceae bacterium]MBT5082712.1 SDR family oxidoreductase [Rhodospirillaceae bacterium]MBT5524124.1 SDR family oxidoreductase [Rhodospirillaceae bacterium]MBT5880801.1 SDR family oxidoreductase [Rhodospirillaceae bacterium]
MQFKDKVTIVTGGASGIGAACCRNFAERGAKVVVVDLNGEGANSVAAEFGGLGIGCNVGDEAEINAMIKATEEHFGPVDILFNNAGINSGREIMNTDLSVWQDQWNVNLMSHVYAVRAVLPGMIERGAGYIMHTASMAGILMSHGNLPYTVSKHAVVGLAEYLSVTHHHEGIRVSLLAPLGVRTPMLGDTDKPFATTAAGPIKEPEEVAEQVATAVEEERFLILTDEIAQTWMDGKNNDLERWLKGMRRMQDKIQSLGGRDP